MTPPATTQRYELIPDDTTVRLTTRHLLGLGAVNGQVRLVSGSAETDGADTLVSVTAELDMTSFDSASSARDKAVASRRLLDSAVHPRATFHSTDVERVASGWRVQGVLTVKGVSSPVELRVEHLEPATRVQVRASARVDRRRHGVTIPQALAARHLEIAIAATARLTPRV